MALSNNNVVIDGKHLTLKNKPAEIYSMGFEYSLVSPDGEACHRWVMCKDFMNDVIWGILANKPVSIFGFTWNKTDNPSPDMHAVRLVVRNRNVSPKKFAEQMAGLADFLNQIEKEMGVSSSIICPVKGKGSLYYIQSGIRWLRHPAMFSLYLLLVRTGCVHVVKTPWRKTMETFLSMKPAIIKSQGMTQNDVSYLKQANKLVEPIIVCGGQCFPPAHRVGWQAKENVNVGTIHSGSGIVAMTRAGYSFPVRSSKNAQGLGIQISKGKGPITIKV